jgi:GNAT superfamily N-acetyltransferase
MFSATYLFVRGRQLEGTFPGDAQTGIWPITALRIGRGWGAIPGEAWKSDSSIWPPDEPPGLDAMAKSNRDFRYQRVRSLAEAKLVLSTERLVKASIEITDAWFSVEGGKIPESSVHDAPIGSHSVLLIGYDDHLGQLKFQNSWGTTWGDRGFGYISYGLFQTTWTEGWMEDVLRTPPPTERKSAASLVSWALKEHTGGVFHCREFLGRETDRIGWSFAVERSENLEIEELFVMPKHRRKGYGSELTKQMQDLAHERALKLKVWIPHVDSSAQNLAIVERLVAKIGLRTEPSGVRWASHVAS